MHGAVLAFNRIPLAARLAALSLLIWCGAQAGTGSERPSAPPGMVAIPGGTFTMGHTPADGQYEAREEPAHPVTLHPYFLDAKEVTVLDYRRCVNEGMCTKPKDEGNCTWNFTEREDHPVNCVSWEQARAYCAWAGKRLPTEAEWERAARGGHGEWKFPWGNAVEHERANYQGAEGRDRWTATAPAGSFPPNDYGLYDMAGNVTEWCADWYGEHSADPQTDPAGPPEGRFKVLRGGSWALSDGHGLRVAARYFFDPAFQLKEYGFRCALDAGAGAGAARGPAPTFAAPTRRTSGEKSGSAMVPIPAGTFMMGCTPGDSYCGAAEKPPHKVTVRAFSMDKYEVSVRQFRQCVEAGACAVEKTKGDSPDCNYGYPEREDHPINCVSWSQAKAYCEWRKGRLPTEAEWEYAARGGKEGWPYPWGDGAYPNSARYETHIGTSAIGRYEPNGFSLYDMAGNVWEWCSDYFSETYYAHSPVVDPQGPSKGWARVIRGGDWYSFKESSRVSNRFGPSPTEPSMTTGFRCVRDR